MAHIYIALVDTPGILASMIRAFLKQNYIHVVLSMDAGLEEAYSVGRRNPMIPLFAGFEREKKQSVLHAFPTARYLVYEMDCSSEQKAHIRETLQRDWERRFQCHYAVLGLLFIFFNHPFYQKNHYTCSSYIARLLEENDIRIAEKHFSLVTPKDFLLYRERREIFEGYLYELTEMDRLTSRERIPAERDRQKSGHGRIPAETLAQVPRGMIKGRRPGHNNGHSEVAYGR